MKKHKKHLSAKNSYQCDMCGKCFISWNNIHIHMKIHARNNQKNMFSVWRGIHLQEQHQETPKDPYCGKSPTLSSVGQGPNHLEPLEE